MLLQQQLRGLQSAGDDHIDLTPMVDTVFQLLTFLLLTYQVSSEAAVAMPEARHGVGVDETEAAVLTIARPTAEDAPAAVYFGLKTDPARQLLDDDAIQQAVEQAVVDGKQRVVLQADAEVPHGEVLRVAGAAARVEGVSIHIGVEERK